MGIFVAESGLVPLAPQVCWKMRQNNQPASLSRAVAADGGQESRAPRQRGNRHWRTGKLSYYGSEKLHCRSRLARTRASCRRHTTPGPRPWLNPPRLSITCARTRTRPPRARRSGRHRRLPPPPRPRPTLSIPVSIKADGARAGAVVILITRPRLWPRKSAFPKYAGSAGTLLNCAASESGREPRRVPAKQTLPPRTQPGPACGTARSVSRARRTPPRPAATRPTPPQRC